MNDGDAMAAELLARSSTAYAASASNRLLEKVPEVKTQFGEAAFSHWQDYYSERVKELSVAIAENEPALFLSRVRWSRAAFQAREVSEKLLRESLECLGEVLNEELPASCRKIAGDYISSALRSFEELEESAVELAPHDPESKLAMQYLLQILEGDSPGAIRLIVAAFEQGLEIENTYRVLMMAQQEIGRMWHQGDINIAEEHLVTTATERAMAVLAHVAAKQPANGLTAVSAAVTGNRHGIGVRAVSDFFEFAGWRSICLGSDLPPIDIAEATKYFDSSIVMLSATLSTQLKAVRATIHAVRAMNPDCKIMVGGLAFYDTPDLWIQMGSDAFASTPAEAVSNAARLFEH